MILHIQSSFPKPSIMDRAYLSCILNAGTELEARYFIPAVINAKDRLSVAREKEGQCASPGLRPHCKNICQQNLCFFAAEFASLQTASPTPTANPANCRNGRRPTRFHMQRTSRSGCTGDVGLCHYSDIRWNIFSPLLNEQV